MTRELRTGEILDPFADQSESLRWTALMITGTAEIADRSIIDATGLAETSRREFRDWLVLWAHLATARTALNAVRSAIQEAAERYADWTCAHTRHEPLPWAEIRRFQQLDAARVVQQLDVLARAALVLHGCHGVSFEDCVFLLNVPLQSAVGAYCTALEWYKAFTEPAERDGAGGTSASYIFRLRPKWTFGL